VRDLKKKKYVLTVVDAYDEDLFEVTWGGRPRSKSKEEENFSTCSLM